mmetsp:Transcript_16406/g.34683  ORF Transcript_16406/g.34683 Transcript_16406/m.34683 type:complete len:82 (-) Transcript_16406:433-678(-)
MQIKQFQSTVSLSSSKQSQYRSNAPVINPLRKQNANRRITRNEKVKPHAKPGKKSKSKKSKALKNNKLANLCAASKFNRNI